MTYPETIKYLETFINYEKIPAYPYKESLKLERLEGFLDTIGNPHHALKFIHVAGTKGKGSTCAFITYILREAGFKVGLYTSPHLSDFRERIRILAPNPEPRTPNPGFEGMILEDELGGLVNKLKAPIEKYNNTSVYGPLSFFEIYTALAFIYFKEKKIDLAVVETGLGGRLDATNVVNPYACAITPISYEHTQKLGNTLKEIAAEKAGIIKTPGLSVISAPQEKEAGGVIRNRCKEAGARLYEVGRDITYEKNGNGFSIKGVSGNYPDLNIRLLGEHQVINATVAVGVIEALRKKEIKVNIEAIRGGLNNTLWPGRCEVVAKKPLVILDGAQNIASSRALKETIKNSFQYKKLFLILGISKDKDIPGICNQLYDLADEVVLTKADNARAIDPQALARYFPGKITHLTDSVREAKLLSRRLSGSEDLILVTGSLFILSEFRNGAL